MKASSAVLTVATVLASFVQLANSLPISSTLVSIDPISPFNESLVELLPSLQEQETDNHNRDDDNNSSNTLPISIIPLLPFDPSLLEDLRELSPILMPEDPTLETQSLEKKDDQPVSTQPVLMNDHDLNPVIINILPIEFTNDQLDQDEPKAISINDPVQSFDPSLVESLLEMHRDGEADEEEVTISINPVVMISVDPLAPLNKTLVDQLPPSSA